MPDGDDKAAAFAAATARHYGTASSEPSDALLRELANYFKGPQFFTWVKKPPCPRCGGKTEGAGPGTPTEEEKRKRATWVLENTGSLEDLERALKAVLAELTGGAKGGRG